MSRIASSFGVDIHRPAPDPLPLVFAVGALWTLSTFVSAARTRRKWRSASYCGQSLQKLAHEEHSRTVQRVRIRRLPGTSFVASTGLLRPEVWIGSRVKHEGQLAAALAHELSHVASGDQLTLFAIVTLERLLWWNPMVWLLGRRARQQMEYACDSRCRTLLGEPEYRRSLASLYLDQNSMESALELPLGRSTLITKRMERLGMKYSLKAKHVAAMFLGALPIAVASNSFADDDFEKRPSLIECHEYLPDGVQYDLSITSDIDTRGEDRNTLRMSLTDATKPGVDEIPKEAGEFLKCLQQVMGVGDDEGWPEL